MTDKWYSEGCFFRNVKFRFGDCDPQDRVNLYSLMKLFSEMAGEDYDGRNLGRDLLVDNNQIFLVSRMAIKIHKNPMIMDECVASTWERCIQGPFWCRDYEIRSGDGDLLVASTSQWLLVNPITREILRPAAAVGGPPKGNPKHADCQDCKKIKARSDFSSLGSRPIYYSDLDANDHVNNAIYSKIAVDFMPEELRRLPVREFSIVFNIETMLGETLQIVGAKTDNGYAIDGQDDGKSHFGCEFSF